MDFNRNSASKMFKENNINIAIVTRWLLHLGLFILTFFTTTIAGVFWLNKDPFELSNFSLGIPYSVAILFILASHEFGHYFAARHHKIDATLPYFIPFPSIPVFMQLFLNFGNVWCRYQNENSYPIKKNNV